MMFSLESSPFDCSSWTFQMDSGLKSTTHPRPNRKEMKHRLRQIRGNQESAISNVKLKNE